MITAYQFGATFPATEEEGVRVETVVKIGDSVFTHPMNKLLKWTGVERF